MLAVAAMYGLIATGLAALPAAPVSAQTTVTLQPGPGANAGADDGSASAGKDAGIWPAIWEDKNVGADQGMNVWNSACNVGLTPGYLRFSTAGLPQTAIQSAEISLYVRIDFNGNGWPWGPGTRTIAMRRVLADWNEMQVRQNDQPAVSPTTVAARNFTTTGGGSSGNPFVEFEGWMTFDITSLYRDWVSGALPNHGVQIRQEEDWCANGNTVAVWTSDATDDPARRPLLRVTTTAPPPQAAAVPALSPSLLGVLAALVAGIAAHRARSRGRLP